jgi:hypothetical protein
MSSVQDLAHQRIVELIEKALAEAVEAAKEPTLKSIPRERRRRKIREHLAVCAEWIQAMDNIDRGY